MLSRLTQRRIAYYARPTVFVLDILVMVVVIAAASAVAYDVVCG